MDPGAPAPSAAPTPPRPLIVAHRGAWDAAPQNSLEALEAAISLGCDAIEIDVRRTADGRLVLVHDARLRWQTVGRLEHDQVKARMQLGQAPLLHDVLSVAAGRILVDVELKEDGYVIEAMRTVRSHLSDDQYVVTSFHPAVLAQVRGLVPPARTGLLIGPARRRELPRRLQHARPTFLAPHISLLRAGVHNTPATAHLDLWVWTVNDDRTLRALAGHSRVRALITDRPERALALAA